MMIFSLGCMNFVILQHFPFLSDIFSTSFQFNFQLLTSKQPLLITRVSAKSKTLNLTSTQSVPPRICDLQAMHRQSTRLPAVAAAAAASARALAAMKRCS